MAKRKRKTDPETLPDFPDLFSILPELVVPDLGGLPDLGACLLEFELPELCLPAFAKIKV